MAKQREMSENKLRHEVLSPLTSIITKINYLLSIESVGVQIITLELLLLTMTKMKKSKKLLLPSIHKVFEILVKQMNETRLVLARVVFRDDVAQVNRGSGTSVSLISTRSLGLSGNSRTAAREELFASRVSGKNTNKDNSNFLLALESASTNSSSSSFVANSVNSLMDLNMSKSKSPLALRDSRVSSAPIAASFSVDRETVSAKALFVLPPLLNVFIKLTEINSGFVASKVEKDILPLVISMLTTYCREYIQIYDDTTSKASSRPSPQSSSSSMKYSVDSKVKTSIIIFFEKLIDLFSIRSSIIRIDQIIIFLLMPFLASVNLKNGVAIATIQFLHKLAKIRPYFFKLICSSLATSETVSAVHTTHSSASDSSNTWQVIISNPHINSIFSSNPFQALHPLKTPTDRGSR